MFSMFAVITDLEVILLVKAVKWHHNTAALKLKLNLCIILKTQITLRIRKTQQCSPYHSMLSFFPKSKTKLLDENILLKGGGKEKSWSFPIKILQSLWEIWTDTKSVLLFGPPTPSDTLTVPDGLYYRMTSPLFFYYDLWVTNYL